MNTASLIEHVCRLPDRFRSEEKSILQIVSESGIENNQSVLTAENIVPCLVAHPELINKWLDWSADNRSSPSWYFRSRLSGYEVGYRPKGEVLKFTKLERAQACAEFIIRDIRDSLSYIEKIRKKGGTLNLTVL